MKKQPKQRRFPVKPVITFILVFLACYAFLVYLNRTLRNLPYFKVKNIIVNQQDAHEFSYLKGRPIFELDLKKESRYIAQVYPYYEKVRVIRILPNSLFVDFVKRKPVAYLKLSRYFYIDEKLVLWEAGEQEAAQLPGGSIPVITGMDAKITAPKTGRMYALPELVFVVELIKEARGQKILKDYKIHTIEIKNLSNITLFMEVDFTPLDTGKGKYISKCKDIEIKVSVSNVKEKTNILTGLFLQLQHDLCTIQYIDLRFKDPVIKFNDA